MIETNIPEINVDELMEKIRAEVRHRKERGGTQHLGLPRANYAAPSDLYAKVDLSKICPVPDHETFELKESYHINDFLKYHDQDFVISAYRGILRRGPDSEGLRHFLEALRSGKMTKAEVLGRLRYAPEGKAKRVKIKGLSWNFFIQSSFRIPVVGYLSRLMTAIVNFPVILRNIQVLEEGAFAQLQQRRDDLNKALGQLGSILDRKADRDEVGGLKADITGALEQKADRVELAGLGDRKADRDEVGGLKAEVERLLDEKADKEQMETINDQIRDILRQTRDHKLNIIEQQRRLKLLLEEARKRLPEPLSIRQITEMVKEEEHMLNAAYIGFEDKFRGTRQDIKGRQKIYLPFLKAAGAGTAKRPVLDVGCGRGEWLELLKENEFVALGVESNQVMQRVCKDLGLQVEMGDAIDFLVEQKPNTLGAVTGFHIVEHLSTKNMVALFDEAMRVLRPGGIVIFETPNPENILVGSCTFYTDPTHNRPIPPDTLLYLIENRGFVEPEIIRSSPLNYASYSGEDALKDIFHRFNMEQDYAVIARKPS